MLSAENEGECATHITVICRGRMFNMDVVDAQGEVRTVPELRHDIKLIHDQCHNQPYGLSLGALTTERRDTWWQVIKLII